MGKQKKKITSTFSSKYNPDIILQKLKMCRKKGRGVFHVLRNEETIIYQRWINVI